MRQEETNIKDAIFDYLKRKKIFCWNINNSPPYSVQKRTYLRPYRHSRNGISDICGIFKRRALFIEVKTSSGKIADDQREFKSDVEREGGIHIFARSIDDVMEVLDAQA